MSEQRGRDFEIIQVHEPSIHEWNDYFKYETRIRELRNTLCSNKR